MIIKRTIVGEQMARPKELLGGGGMAAPTEMVDWFPAGRW